MCMPSVCYDGPMMPSLLQKLVVYTKFDNYEFITITGRYVYMYMYLCWWTICPRGYHPTLTHMSYLFNLLLYICFREKLHHFFGQIEREFENLYAENQACK